MEEKEETKTNNENEEVKESELLKLQREKYEKIIEDKNKIIKDLLNGTHDGKAEEKEKQLDEEEKAKLDEEERRKKRVAFYKKYIR